MPRRPGFLAAASTLMLAAVCSLGSPRPVRAETAHLKPDPSCVPVGVSLQLGLTGAKFAGAGVWSDDTSIATASESGVVTGKKVGETKIHIGGAAELVSWGDTHLKVVAKWADCAATYKAVQPPKFMESSDADSFKFTFTSDPQGSSGKIVDKKTVNHQFAIWFAGQMAEVEKPKFILVGGDLANYGPDSHLWIDDTVANLKTKAGRSVVGEIPIYCAIGNHDLVDNALGYYKESMQDGWAKVWADNYVVKGGPAWPLTGPEDLSSKWLAYAFVYGNSLFIVIDAYYLWGNAEFHKRTSDHGELEEIDAKQLAWVAWLSDWAKKVGTTKGLKHIFLVSHAPLLTEDRPNNDQLKKIMAENAMFDAMLSGHRHELSSKEIALGNHSVYQLIDGTAAGGNEDHSYLRLQVNGPEVTVTSVHETKDGPVDKSLVHWTK